MERAEGDKKGRETGFGPKGGYARYRESGMRFARS